MNQSTNANAPTFRVVIISREDFIDGCNFEETQTHFIVQNATKEKVLENVALVCRQQKDVEFRMASFGMEGDIVMRISQPIIQASTKIPWDNNLTKTFPTYHDFFRFVKTILNEEQSSSEEEQEKEDKDDDDYKNE